MMSAIEPAEPDWLWGNVLGAFADCAVLFPLLLLLGTSGTLAPTMMLFGAGAAYMTAAAVFRVPMPVQPLKSIAVAALAAGAGSLEVRVAGIMLGVTCLAVGAFHLDRWLARIPVRVVHQVQAGLAALLLLQGWRSLGMPFSPHHALALVLALGILLVPPWKGVPWMGLAAAAAMFYAVLGAFSPSGAISGGRAFAPAEAGLRLAMVAGLLLPQVALTFANSVLGAEAAVQRYYPGRASRVTLRALLYSIGLGNVLAGLLGALPFCHGSGGVTAHYHGGARDWWSSWVIGGFLLALGLISMHHGFRGFAVPGIFLAGLLAVTGVQHLRLACGGERDPVFLALSFFVALAAQNLLWVLGLALAREVVTALLSCLSLPAHAERRTP